MHTEIEKNVAKNLSELRKASGLKQSELGEKIGYSDKTISKWENGVSVPDVCALSDLANFFNVTVDDFLNENAVAKIKTDAPCDDDGDKANNIATLCLSITTVYFVAVSAFVALQITKNYVFWQIFIWALAPCALLVHRYNRYNDDVRWVNAVSLSVCSWVIITAVYLQLLQYNLWQLFFIMLPMQAMIIVSTLFRKKRKPRDYLARRIMDLFNR